MKRHKSIIELSRDHQKGLMLAQLLKKDAPPYKGLPTDVEGKMNYAIETFQSHLIKHFEDEEKILFPISKGKSEECDNLISELSDDHQFFYKNFSSLKPDADLEDLLDNIGHRLESHIRKEEREFFNLIQNLLSEEDLKVIENKIQKSREDFQKSCKTKK
ncbi:MAG: hemerythrin domain-containing protein [Ignavibacterium sp.]|nr:hemerythrin domain-containing protein [Ignavibacterium sp.]